MVYELPLCKSINHKLINLHHSRFTTTIMEKQYTNGEITIVWKPDACIHSTLCWRGMVDVFNPKKRPWINMEGAESEALIAQVEKCPSGALSFFRNNKAEAQPETVEVETIVEATSHKVTFPCCGAFGNKPYCDGSHRKIDFKG